jgi:subtilisin family serine protease
LKYISYFRDQNGFAVRVLNASFGKFQRSRAVSLLVRLLREEETGVVIIGAAGNEDAMKANYPAGYSDAIAVSNIHQGGAKHESSNFGRWVDIAAPGDEINSTVPGGQFERKTGTSMAAPVVAGVAGLLLSVSPTLTYKEIRDRLILTSDASTLYSNQINAKYFKRFKGEPAAVPLLGSGMVDAESAVKKELTENLPIVSALDRVTVSCGQLGTTLPSGFSVQWLLGLPLLLVGFRRPKKSRNR